MRQATQRFEALIEASPLAIIVCDADGRVEKWNTSAERMFGWPEKEVLGGAVPLFPVGQEDESSQQREAILRGDTFADVEAVRMRKDGTPISVSISAAPIRDASGKTGGYLMIVADVTQRKRAEQRQDLENAVTVLLADAHTLEEVMPRVIRTICQSLGFEYGARWMVDRKEQRQNVELRFRADKRVCRYLVEKGSICVDGVSLTLGVCKDDTFTVYLIPHTLEQTTLQFLGPGDPVNLEADIIGKYVERFVALQSRSGEDPQGVSRELLEKHGFTGPTKK